MPSLSSSSDDVSRSKLNNTGQGSKMGTGWDAGWGYVVPL
jgi:hypothetical protein